MNEAPAKRELDGSVAVITGSAKNLGRGMALTLALAGAAIVVNGRSSTEAAQSVADEIIAAGGKAIVHMADVSQPDGAQGVIDAALDAYGRLDILINNVGTRIAKPLVEVSFEEWRAVHAGTLDAAFLCTRAAIPHLADHGRGVIINIGGVSGHAGVAKRSTVAAAKAGIAGLTASLGIELAPQDITVNCVAPGHIEHEGEPGRLSEHFQLKPTPAKHVGQPSDIADMVRLLCGPSGRYITGQTIHVNGGWYVSIA